MKKKTRVLIGALVLTLAATSLAGCGNGGETKDGEITSLTWYAPGDAQSDQAAVMEKVNEQLAEKIGAKLDLIFVDTGAFEERMRMKMAAGEAFDVSFVGYCNPYDAVVKNGGLYPLEKLIDETAPKLKEAVPDYLWQAVRAEDDIFAVPNEQTMAACRGAFLKKDLVEKYHFDTSKIKGMDDLEEFLALVKQNDPDLYPLQVKAGPWMWSDMKYEEVTGGYTDLGIRIGDESLQVVDLYETPEYQHGLQKLHEWFKKGYIRPDIASMTGDTTEVSAGKYAVTLGTTKPGADAEIFNRYGYEVEMVEIIPPYLKTDATKATMTGIGAKSKNPKKAIELIELVNTDKDFYNALSFGIEGKHYEKLADGKAKAIAGSGWNNSSNAWKFGNQFNAMLLDGQQDDLWEATKKQNDESQKSLVLGFVFDTDPVVNYMSQIETVRQKYKVRNTGAEDPANYWDTYIADMKTAGRDEVKAELQKQLDEFKKNK